MSINQPHDVALAVLSNMYHNAWNSQAAFKNPNNTWTMPFGALYINWEIADVPRHLDKNTQVNEATPGDGLEPVGLTAFNSTDPQVNLQYLHAVAMWKACYPNDTTFDLPNGNNQLGIAQMVDHLTLYDFQPATSSTTGGYLQLKGWVYWALLDIYLQFQNSPLLTSAQVTALQQSTLYQAFTYLNSFWDSTNLYTAKTTYQPSQSLLASAAVIDAAQRFPSLIKSGMFFDNTPFSPQTAAGWLQAGKQSADNLLYRGAWNNTYKYFNGVMNVVHGATQDTVNNPIAKADDTSEDAIALVRLYQLTGQQRYADFAKACLEGIDNLLLDTANGGYYSNFNNSNGVLNAAYKECRATFHMLYAYTLYNRYVSNNYYAQRCANITTTICDHMYKVTNANNGFYYRVLPDASFGFYTDNYTPDFASTLAASIKAGDTSCKVVDNPSALSADQATIINLGGWNEELFVASYQNQSGSGPYVLPYNQGANSPLSFSLPHNPGEPIQTMLYPIRLKETQITTEAMANACVYLLYSVLNAATNAVPPQSDGSNQVIQGSPTYSSGPQIPQMSYRRPSLLNLFEMDIENLLTWIRRNL